MKGQVTERGEGEVEGTEKKTGEEAGKGERSRE